jgi:hypothetical protein
MTGGSASALIRPSFAILDRFVAAARLSLVAEDA